MKRKMFGREKADAWARPFTFAALAENPSMGAGRCLP